MTPPAEAEAGAPHNPAADFCFAISCKLIPGPCTALLLLRLDPLRRLAKASPLALGFAWPPKDPLGDVTLPDFVPGCGVVEADCVETDVK